MAALKELAAAIRANPLWSKLPGAMLMGRCAPEPLLVVGGAFNDEQQSLLGALQVQLALLMQEREIVDDGQAEAVCDQRAGGLVVQRDEATHPTDSSKA